MCYIGLCTCAFLSIIVCWKIDLSAFLVFLLHMSVHLRHARTCLRLLVLALGHHIRVRADTILGLRSTSSFAHLFDHCFSFIPEILSPSPFLGDSHSLIFHCHRPSSVILCFSLTSDCTGTLILPWLAIDYEFLHWLFSDSLILPSILSMVLSFRCLQLGILARSLFSPVDTYIMILLGPWLLDSLCGIVSLVKPVPPSLFFFDTLCSGCNT